ncbi:MAG: F0F1 ATP synthase subunit gamma [Thermodesulfobacteriota bacterium]
MDTLQTLDKRISTTAKLQGIVKSMKTLSAVNIRQYERALASLDTFVEVIELGLQTVLKQTTLPGGAAAERLPRGLIIFGSDQGLCGRFNERLADYVRQQLAGMAATDFSSVKLLVIGARMAARLEAAGFAIDQQFWVPGSVNGINATVYQLLLSVEGWLTEHGIGRVDIFLNRYEKSAGARPDQQVLLPIANEHLRALRKKQWPGRSLPGFRAPADQLFSGLLRQYLFASLFRSQAESLASEQASRLRSLQNAEKNIAEHIEELRGAYRIKRQATITSELLDLVAGFKATVGAESKQTARHKNGSPPLVNP